MTNERRPAGPTWYGDRRVSDTGITSVLIDVRALEGVVTLVGGDAAAAARALVPELLMVANLALRNPAHASTIEVIGRLTISIHGGPLGFGVDDDGVVTLADLNHYTLRSGPRTAVRYLAIAGGVQLGTGALAGTRPLLVGEALRPAGQRGALVAGPGRLDLRLSDPIRIHPGPDAARFAPGAFEALQRSTWTVQPGTDRVVVRLSAGTAGASFAPQSSGPSAASAPRGALAVTPSGDLLCLGPDHPAASVHPILALVAPPDLGRLAARAAGAPVTFA